MNTPCKALIVLALLGPAMSACSLDLGGWRITVGATDTPIPTVAPTPTPTPTEIPRPTATLRPSATPLSPAYLFQLLVDATEAAQLPEGMRFGRPASVAGVIFPTTPIPMVTVSRFIYSAPQGIVGRVNIWVFATTGEARQFWQGAASAVHATTIEDFFDTEGYGRAVVGICEPTLTRCSIILEVGVERFVIDVGLEGPDPDTTSQEATSYMADLLTELGPVGDLLERQ